MNSKCNVILRRPFLSYGEYLTKRTRLLFYCEAIGTAATPGLLCQHQVILKMIVEKQMECRLAGETEVLGENLPQRHFCRSQNPTWPTRQFLVRVCVCVNSHSRLSGYSLASHRGGQGSNPGLVMWDLWWTKWRWGTFSPSTSVSHAFISISPQSPIIRGWYNRLVVTAVPKVPPHKLKKINAGTSFDTRDSWFFFFSAMLRLIWIVP
jgi:hypothetical protein